MTADDRKTKKRRRTVHESSDEDPVEEVVDVDLHENESLNPPSLNGLTVDNEGFSIDGGKNDTSWVQRYADTAAQTGLVVSSKKKKEFTEWLRRALDYSGPRLLMLGGPPGCGKSSVVQATCKELNCSIASWQAPFVGSRGICNALLDDFRAFFVGSRYPTLQLEDDDDAEKDATSRSGRRILLVEDLPVHITDFEQNKESLRKIFFDAAQFAPLPTVVVLSDGEKGIARLARLLLGLDMLSSPAVAKIKIPAVTSVMMKRRLKEVMAVEGFSVTPRQLDLVISTSRGDMRAALNCLQLSSATGEDDNPDGIIADSRKRRRPKPRTAVAPLAEISHDLTLSTYHAISKVLNNKREEDGASKYNAEDVLDEARTDTTAFLDFLHQNYLEFFGNPDDVVPTLFCLSEADTFMPWIQEADLRNDLTDCAASVVTRAFLHFNSNPSRSSWRPIKGPVSREVIREMQVHSQSACETLSNIVRPQVFSRSDLYETIAYAERIKRIPSERRRYSTGDRDVASSSLTNDADVAMVDLESSTREGPVLATGTVATATTVQLGGGEAEDGIEDIEDWED